MGSIITQMQQFGGGGRKQ